MPNPFPLHPLIQALDFYETAGRMADKMTPEQIESVHRLGRHIASGMYEVITPPTITPNAVIGGYTFYVTLEGNGCRSRTGVRANGYTFSLGLDKTETETEQANHA